jgi:hypothetical protein
MKTPLRTGLSFSERRRTMTNPGKQNVRLLFAIYSAVVLAAGGCARSEPPSTLQSSNTKGGPEATEIDRSRPLCPQLEAAAEAVIDSLLTKHDVVNREWKFDVLPRVDCWSIDDKHTSTLPLRDYWRWRYDARHAHGVAVLGLLYLSQPSNRNGFTMRHFVREWRDELIRRGFNPRSEKWDLKLVWVGAKSGIRYSADENCVIYSHGSDMIDGTDLEMKAEDNYRYLRIAIRSAGELCHEPTPEEREERRKSLAEYQEWKEEECREGKLEPEYCKHLSD